MLCPECKAQLDDGVTTCYVCGAELDAEREDSPDDEQSWVLIGYIGDKITADFAKETLLTYEIPCVIMSRSGFFGDIGLSLTSFFGSSKQLFEVSVPMDLVAEAKEILENTVGSGWKPADEDDKQAN